MDKKAFFIKNIEGWRGDTRLYKLVPPLVEVGYDDKTIEGTHEFVIVSAIVADFSGPETFIFPADQDGETTSMMELPGSFQGGLDHAEALAGAGYEIVPAALTHEG